RGRDRRQGREHRRPSARWRGARDYRSILCVARATRRRRWPRCQARPVQPAWRMVRRPPMKPAAFDYVRAESLDEALDVLRDEGSDARVIAGGQSLVPMLNMRLARPRVLVDIMHLQALRGIEPRQGKIAIGAAVRQADLLQWPALERELRLV